MTELFHSSQPEAVAHAYDRSFIVSSPGGSEVPVQEHYRDLPTSEVRRSLKTQVESLLVLHGFACLPVQSLLPAFPPSLLDEELAAGGCTPYEVMDRAGLVLSVPHNLRLCFVRQFVHNDVRVGRFFAVDKVNVQPKTGGEFDVQHPTSRSRHGPPRGALRGLRGLAGQFVGTIPHLPGADGADGQDRLPRGQHRLPAVPAGRPCRAGEGGRTALWPGRTPGLRSVPERPAHLLRQQQE